MFTGVIVSLAAVLIIIFLFLYKKEMIIKMFTLNISAPASEFTEQLEQTAEAIIRRLEDEAAELEILLEEAETKIGMLSQQVEHANDLIKQLTLLEENRPATEQSQPAALPAAEVVIQLADDNTAEPPANKPENADDAECERINPEKHGLILAMADQGYNVTEIAKATGMGKGEIMLLLQLNKK